MNTGQHVPSSKQRSTPRGVILFRKPLSYRDWNVMRQLICDTLMPFSEY
ncbi:hypothetical protein GA0061084_2066 [Arthrobacter sp. NIO-1057]|nr:hypothetical protein GA0061084_2066 [Arthrobacter sp. NIO-1057]